MNQSQYLKHLKRCEEIKSGPVIVDLEEKEPLYIRLIDALIVIVGLFAFILILGYMQQKDLEDEVEAHKASSQRYAGMLAECLNGGSLLDKTSGKGFFCGKAIEVQL